MKPKKILFVSKDASWQRYRNEVLHELTLEYGCQVDVITSKNVKDYIKDTDKLKYFKSIDLFSMLGSINLFPYVFYFILTKKPDAVLALPNASNITELLLSVFCKITKTKLVYWTHGYDHCQRPEKGLSGLFNKIRVKVINYCLTLADSIIVFSPLGKSYLVDQGVIKEKIFVAPNTLNTRALAENYNRTTSEQISAFKHKHELENKTVFLFSGRLREGKRLDNFIKAAANVENKDDIALVIVGDGEMEYIWKQQCEEAGFRSVFLGPVFNEEYLSVIFKASDWFVMPGYVGLAIVHAFSHGLPILTENISFHSPEIYYLENGVNGQLFKEGDAQEWKEFIEKASLDIEFHKELSNNALKTVHEKASIEVQLQGIANSLGVTSCV